MQERAFKSELYLQCTRTIQVDPGPLAWPLDVLTRTYEFL